jgi:hypothetical protein
VKLAALVLTLAVFAASSGSLAAASGSQRARLTASGIETLKVRGSGFHANERVRLTITPSSMHRIVRHIRATRGGTSVASPTNVRACAGVTGVATGRRGSHACRQ